MMDDKQKDALNRLKALRKKGDLYIVTDEHACCGGVKGYGEMEIKDERGRMGRYVGPPSDVCTAFDHPRSSPLHFVCHPVISIEGPDDRGRCTARSAEGDWTMGYPEALLSKLTEYRRAVLQEELP